MFDAGWHRMSLHELPFLTKPRFIDLKSIVVRCCPALLYILKLGESISIIGVLVNLRKRETTLLI